MIILSCIFSLLSISINPGSLNTRKIATNILTIKLPSITYKNVMFVNAYLFYNKQSYRQNLIIANEAIMNIKYNITFLLFLVFRNFGLRVKQS